MKAEEDKRSEQQAEAQLESIREMVAALRKADSGDEYEIDAARSAIHEDALLVEIRSDWYSPGGNLQKPSEYKILLCTGGPACQIRGELSVYGEPETARIEHQDWGTRWTEYRISSEDEEILLEYARCFYFGD
jgi:hypothetical protein